MPFLPIPSSSKEITPEWVAQVTGHVVDPAAADDFHVDGDTLAGIGYLSRIYRVSYKTKDGDNKHNIIVKLLPSDSKWLEIATSECTDKREIQFYTVILPDLLKVVPELQENVCKYYNGGVEQADKSKGTERASMLIVEDLKASGFEMMEYCGERSDRNVHGMITFLARLHFAALAIEVKKGASLPQLYPFVQGIAKSDEWNKRFVKLCDKGYPHLEKLLQSHNVSKNTWKRYEKLRPYTRAIVEKVEASGRRNPCLIHGDVWPPNIQVHPGGLPVKVLDWQMVAYRDVAFDISVMLCSILPKEKFTTENLHGLVRQYYKEFEQLCQEKGFGDKIRRRSLREFEKFFFTWGLAFWYIICLPFVEYLTKGFEKYSNVFRVLCEENNLPEFLERECS